MIVLKIGAKRQTLRMAGNILEKRKELNKCAREEDMVSARTCTCGFIITKTSHYLFHKQTIIFLHLML